MAPSFLAARYAFDRIRDPTGKLARAGAICAFVAAATTSVAAFADPSSPSPADAGAVASTFDSEHFFDAIVKIETRAVPGARSAATLGSEREGTGIIISPDGLILTIGYLLVEADEMTIVDRRGRRLPARSIAYDHASGFGLVRSVVPIDATPIPLGDSAKIAQGDPVMIVSADGGSGVTLAFIVSKRPFSGSWEYLLDQAIYTAPPTMNWSGAALIGKDMKLLGVGSLVVREAVDGDPESPGNVFVPIDVLKPILADLVKSGHRAGPARPWLGVSSDEVQGRVVVVRVSPGGPGDKAGLRVGDIILGVNGDGVRTQAEFYRKVWSRGAAGTEIPLRVLQGIDIRTVTLHSIDRVEYFRPKTTY